MTDLKTKPEPFEADVLAIKQGTLPSLRFHSNHRWNALGLVFRMSELRRVD